MSVTIEVLAELAPNGVIRAAVNVGNAVLARVDNLTGKCSGRSVDIARKLAAETGCSLSIVKYESAASIIAATDKDEWDIAFIAADPARTDRFVFSTPYTFVVATFLVPDNSPLSTVADVDKEGCRISAPAEAAYTKQLERQLEHAVIVPTQSPIAALEALKSGKSDAAAGLVEPLRRFADENAGFRVLPDAFSKIPQSIAVGHSKRHSSAYLESFVKQELGGEVA